MSTQGNGGILSKFQERLRKIRLSRSKKKQNNKEIDLDNELNLKRTSINTVKSKNDEFLSNVLSDIKDTSIDRVYIKRPLIRNDRIEKKVANKEITIVKETIKYENKVIDKINIKPDNKESLFNDVEFTLKEVPNNKKVRKVIKENNIVDDSKQAELNVLGSEIIDKIKDSFEEKLDELEVIMSELYLLNQQQNSELELKKIEELKKKINQIIERINEIIEQHNLYKNNYYLDNIIGIDDNIIVEDIIKYRTILESLDKEKQFVKDYKALNEFKKLYNNLRQAGNEVDKIKDNNEDKILEYQIRDKKYNNVKLEMIAVLDINKKCALEIEQQNEQFDKLMSKIGIIDSREYVTRHMNGISDLIGQSLKYMGLMILSPLSGLIPGITIQTLATKKMIGNIYKRLHLEEVKHIEYSTINYDNELNQHLNDANYTEDLINDTLIDVKRLKEDFMMIYNSNLAGYDDTLKKIYQIEKNLIHNQNKISIIKKNINNSKTLNSDTLRKVRELNNN